MHQYPYIARADFISTSSVASASIYSQGLGNVYHTRKPCNLSPNNLTIFVHCICMYAQLIKYSYVVIHKGNKVATN